MKSQPRCSSSSPKCPDNEMRTILAMAHGSHSHEPSRRYNASISYKEKHMNDRLAALANAIPTEAP